MHPKITMVKRPTNTIKGHGQYEDMYLAVLQTKDNDQAALMHLQDGQDAETVSRGIRSWFQRNIPDGYRIRIRQSKADRTILAWLDRRTRP